MRELEFNFNNEVDTFHIQEEDDGTIIIPGEDGPLATYQSLAQFAEVYAQARDVKPEHLKNWILVENGDVVSFVLRAGTAGVSADAIAEELEAALTAAEQEAFHPLDVKRLRKELIHAEDVMDALAMSGSPDAARFVYDRLDAANLFEPVAEEDEEEDTLPEDTRSDLERYLDTVLEEDHTLAFFATLVNLEKTAGKEEIQAAIEASAIPYTAPMLANLYESAITKAKEGYQVETRFDALCVMLQMAPGEPDDAVKKQIRVATEMAGRSRVNLPVYQIGRKHIEKAAALVPLEELAEQTLYQVGSAAVMIRFDETVDERAEAKLAEARQAFEDEYDDDEYEEYKYDEDDDEYVRRMIESNR